MGTGWRGFALLLVVAAGCGPGAAPKPQGAAPTTKQETGAPAERAGIAWAYTDDLTGALAEAKKTNQPVMVDVFATWCAPCKLLDENVFSRPDVGEAAKAFVTLKLDGDKNPEAKASLRVAGYPTVLFLAPDGKEIGRSFGSVSYDIMLEAMANAQRKLAGKA